MKFDNNEQQLCVIFCKTPDRDCCLAFRDGTVSMETNAQQITDCNGHVIHYGSGSTTIKLDIPERHELTKYDCDCIIKYFTTMREKCKK